MKVFIIFLIYLNVALGLNILAVLHHSMKSHHIIASSILDSLLDAGHNVTAITHHKNEPRDNYRVVHIPDIMKDLEVPDQNPIDFVNFPKIIAPIYFPFLGFAMIKTVMNSSDLQQFLKRKEKFDICILELFVGEALLGVAEQSECSVIQYTTFDAFFWSDRVVGHNSPSSFAPHGFLEYNDQMSFTQRIWNTYFTLVDKFCYNLINLNIQWWLYNKYFPNAKRSFNEMQKNTSLIFINNHVSSSLVRPMMPAQIEIGGIHVKPAKPLPDDLQKFMDNAADGIILFTMGSLVDGTDWKIEQREAFLKAFGKLKQKVIWRYSNETLPGNPGNIKISSWLPQRDILAHPNMKLFITHGGLLGTTEAIVEGVPVLGIPIFADQLMNMAKTVARGYGLQVLVKDITEENISKALNELLTNPSFKENAKTISRRFIDRQMTPQQEVVYWTEYIARHHGAAHLQAESVNLSSIEFYLIDVYFVLLLVLLAILYVEFKVIKFIVRKFLDNSKSDQKKNQ